MQNIEKSLQAALSIEGALAACLGDWKSGMCMGFVGINNPAFPNEKLELAVAGNTEVIKAKMKAAQLLDLKEDIEDILITLGSQYHLIRLAKSVDGLFFYLVLDRTNSNLALARLKLTQIEKALEF